MATLNRNTVLNTLMKHETLTIDDFSKKENLGMLPNGNELQLLINELVESGHFNMLNGVIPPTYTITSIGIKEAEMLDPTT